MLVNTVGVLRLPTIPVWSMSYVWAGDNFLAGMVYALADGNKSPTYSGSASWLEPPPHSCPERVVARPEDISNRHDAYLALRMDARQIDLVDGGSQCGIELFVAHCDAKVLQERATEAGDHALVPCQLFTRPLSTIAT